MKYVYSYLPLRGKWFPIIPLLVGKNQDWVPVNALLDSGAVVSLFNSGVAKALGIEVTAGEQFKPTGIGGQILSYLHEVVLRIGDKYIKTKVAFSDQMAVPLNLIGREGIFDSFVVSFNDREKKVSLEEV